MIKQRNIATCIILSIITCGIYSFYWVASLTDDSNYISNENGTSGGMVIVFNIISCGIYGLYWAYKMGEKIEIAQRQRGYYSSNNGVLYLILYLFGGIISLALMQNEINKLIYDPYNK